MLLVYNDPEEVDRDFYNLGSKLAGEELHELVCPKILRHHGSAETLLLSLIRDFKFQMRCAVYSFNATT